MLPPRPRTKRKSGHPSHPSDAPSVSSAVPDSTQASLPSLFRASASQTRSIGAGPTTKASSGLSSALPSPSPSKRVRVSSPPPPPPSSMHSDPSVIDLTHSPPSTPPQQRVADSGPAGHGAAAAAFADCAFQPRMGAKRLTIKNLRSKPRVSAQEYLEQVWSQVDQALTAAFDGAPLPHSMEELYRGVENVCRQGGAGQLFDRLRLRCEGHVRHYIQAPLLEKAGAGRSPLETLQLVLSAWTTWNGRLLMVRSIFFYLDRSYLLSTRDLPSLNEMAVDLFRTEVFLAPGLSPAILRGMCDLFRYERTGQAQLADAALLRSATDMVHELLVYDSEFEPRLLAASDRFYEQWAANAACQVELAGYVDGCDGLIQAEMARCERFRLELSTRREMVSMLEEHLIRRRLDVFVRADSLTALLDGGAVAGLEKVYSLLRRVGSQLGLRPGWEAYIKARGTAMVVDEAREAEMVVRLLSFKDKLDRVWRSSFHRDEQLGHSLREAFACFINERRAEAAGGRASNAKPGEMIAKYVDMLLRGGAKAIPSGVADGAEAAPGDDEAALKQQLDQVLNLFRFIDGKDVFEAFYKKDLARRLLMGRSASADAERTMLARLKTECGAGFTHNLEQMFKDVDLARDEMASYKAMRAERGSAGSKLLDLSVNVLSASAWPSYGDVAVRLPPEIGRAIDDYDGYYRSKHTGRKLSWKHSLAHCVVRAQFPKGMRELVVSSFQAIVLVLFNGLADGASLTYEEIQSTTGLVDAELQRTLQSLACARYRVLSKTPKGKEVSATDSFRVNAGFVEAKFRIKINQIQLKETKEEKQATHEDVQRDRQYETQAAIVRIMKSRKTISYSELQAETIKATRKRGAMQGAEIKAQIDKLIEKDYMERDVSAEGIVYKYLA